MNHPFNFLWAASLLATAFTTGQSQDAASALTLSIPKTWDEQALAAFELPLANATFSPKHVSPDYYYQIPVRPIHQSYPVYRPDREPPGYWQWLKAQKAAILWDDKGKRPSLNTQADWLKAGELVFDAPTDFSTGDDASGTFALSEVRDPAWYERNGVRVDSQGVLPDVRYVIRTNGVVELGSISCANCHTRVMSDGSVVKGAQGNFPFERARSYAYRTGRRTVERLRAVDRDNFAMPWSPYDPQRRLEQMSADQILALDESMPPGVMARIRTSPLTPVQIPDLIGVKGRRFLDHTGLVQQRSIADLMRYSAMNQGADGLSSFGGFIPDANDHRTLPPPGDSDRYSDEQLYALALFLYSLKSPPNPNLPKTPTEQTLVRHGESLFRQECARCHDPEQDYSNNKLLRASGFEPAANHPAANRIMTQRVDTDSELTMNTRRGTGLYKVPSLHGLWYRGFFEHNGSCATLEDWFDSLRVEANYVPTGWKGPSKTRAVKGHEFGLDLSVDNKTALIAFLRTL